MDGGSVVDIHKRLESVLVCWNAIDFTRGRKWALGNILEERAK